VPGVSVADVEAALLRGLRALLPGLTQASGSPVVS
jgi:hypothetical protein